MEPYSLEIRVNKTKVLRNLIVCLLFLCIGIWILLAKPQTGNPVFNEPIIKYGAAVLSILFFGFGATWFAGRLRDKRPGLVINDQGIIDRSTLVARDMITWDEIESFERSQVRKQEFILVKLKDPEAYMTRQQGRYKKRLMKYNSEFQGTPVGILLSSLACKANELEEFLNTRLKMYRENH